MELNIDGSTYTIWTGSCDATSCSRDLPLSRPFVSRADCQSINSDDGRPFHFCKCHAPFYGASCKDVALPISEAARSSFSSCPNATLCSRVYGNGACNEECNTKECLYDGHDCSRRRKCPLNQCSARFADGTCDEACNSEECSYDGGDCLHLSDTLAGSLRLNLAYSPAEFVRISRMFLYQLTIMLRTTVLLARDIDGLVIWEWSAQSGRGERLNLDAPQMPSATGVQVLFSVDLKHCSTDCFADVENIVNYVNEAVAKKLTHSYSALTAMVSASVDTDTPAVLSPVWLIVGAILLLSGVILLVGALIRSEKKPRKWKETAPIWHIPFPGQAAYPVKKRRTDDSSSALGSKRDALSLASSISSSHLNVEDANRIDDLGRTPLHRVIRSEMKTRAAIPAVDHLLSSGADINARDADGATPLWAAVQTGRPSFIQYLISKGADTTIVDVRERTLLHEAATYGDVSTMAILLSQPPLAHLVNSVDRLNRTALMYAVMSDTTPDLCDLLINAGADIDFAGDIDPYDTEAISRSPLHIAVHFNQRTIAEHLVARGAKTSSVDSRGRTPLHYAVLYTAHASTDWLRWLVEEAQADVTICDDEDNTAEMLAVKNFESEKSEYLFSVRGKNAGPLTKRQKKIAKRKLRRESTDTGYGSGDHTILDVNAFSPEGASEGSPYHASSPSDLPPMLQSNASLWPAYSECASDAGMKKMAPFGSVARLTFPLSQMTSSPLGAPLDVPFPPSLSRKRGYSFAYNAL